MAAQSAPLKVASLSTSNHFERNTTMKRSILAVAAVFALGLASVSAFAQTAHAAPSSNVSSDRGFGAGSMAHEPAETLNDTFHYPTSD
jgi:hypothetical protein